MPKASTALATMFQMSSLRLTSVGTPRAVWPSATMSAVTASTVAGVRLATTTFAPSRANTFAIAFPMPRPDPVTIATLPSRSPIDPPRFASAAATEAQAL